MAQLRIAFLGLGVMGAPMASTLQRAGRDVVAYDLFEDARQRGRDAGLTVTDDVASLLAGADVVITMLPNTPHVEEAVLGEFGTLAHCRRGTIHIDMSSISPTRTRELARLCREAGIGYVDAPVSGGVKGARSGTLSIMAGGEERDVAAVHDVFEPMAGSITHMGDVGTGQATKVCNQVAVAINIQAVCEAFALGSALGVDLNRLREALLGGASASWMLQNLGPQMLAGDDSAGFRIALQVKDLKLGLEAAQSENVALPGAASALNLYLEAMAHGEEGNGNQSLYRVYERLSGARIAQAADTVGAADI